MQDNLDISIKEIIIKLVREFSNIDITMEDIKDDTDLKGDLGFHSLSSVKLFVEIEQLIGTMLDEDDLNTDLIKSYGNLRACVEKCISQDGMAI